MDFRALKQILIGFGFGTLFIVLSGLLAGGIIFADLLLNLKLPGEFIIFGIPYGFIAGLLYIVFLSFKSREFSANIKNGIFFGTGFWLSFSTLYIIGYLAFSRFQGL